VGKRGEPTRFRDDDEAIQLALFRYGVIGPLVEPREYAHGERSQLAGEIAERSHYLPGRGPIRVSVRTVYVWLRRYRDGGIEALRPRLRRDRGQLRAVDEAVLDRAVRLRKEGPKRWTSTVLDIMKREGTLDGKPVPHRATLDRHLRERGASRRQLRVLGARRHIKLVFDAFGALWVGDYHHGPVVLAPGDRTTTAKLGAFLDHATRYPVADRYYLAEDLASLRHTLLTAFLRWGVPQGKVYVDRGAVYRSEQLRYSLHRLTGQPVLVHSKAYYSEGRGVIERWWQEAKAFEAEIAARGELLTIHELNRLWEAWRELRYCQEVHSALGTTPAEAVAKVTPKPLDPEVARELFLVKASRTVHPKDGCVPLHGRRFLCESYLRGHRVEVRYDPADLSSVVIFAQRQRLGRAFPQVPNTPPEPHTAATDPPAPSVDYLGLLRDDFDRQLIEHARPLRYAELRVEPGFDLDGFAAVVAELAGLELRSPLRRELRDFWDRVGPLPEDLVRIATEHAVRLHGRGRHVRVYLHAIRTLVIAHWRGRPQTGDTP
jgi:transposase